MPPRLIVVFREQPGPRSRRLAALESALHERLIVERVPPKSPPSVSHTIDHEASPGVLQGVVRSAARHIIASTLIDEYELSSWRRFRQWRPSGDFALLIGWPFSPIIAAAARLRLHGIPYIVDAGDPLTIGYPSHLPQPLRGPARARAQRADNLLWKEASGGIVTSALFSNALRARFPELPVLVRPNGYEPVPIQDLPANQPDNHALRLAHFGTLYDARIDLRSFLSGLVASGIWSQVALDQYGPISNYSLHVDGVDVRVRDEVSWSGITEIVGAYDAVLVVGNRSGLGPPSKVFSYMTLPRPRVVVVADATADETAAYVEQMAGWLVVEATGASAAERIHRHTKRIWTAAELAPPESEAWPSVACQIADFLVDVMNKSSPHVFAGLI
jgi:hypothetical protein